MLQSAVTLSEHLDLFERGIAEKIDFAFAGPQSTRLAIMIQRNQVKIGNIHTYNGRRSAKYRLNQARKLKGCG